MKKSYFLIITGILFTLLASCGPGSRTAETSEPSVCSTDSDCPTNYSCSNNVCVFDNSDGASCSTDSDCTSGTCINGSCVTQSSLSQLSTYQTCEYFGYSTSNTSGQCEDSTTSGADNLTLSNVVSDGTIDSGTTDWKSGSGYMRVSEGEALLAELGSSNINGSGVSVAIIGSGANNVVSTDDDNKEINIDTTNSKNFGYLDDTSSTDGTIYYDLTKSYHADSDGRSQFYLFVDGDANDTTTSYSSYNTGETGVICDSDDLTSSDCQEVIYLRDQIVSDQAGINNDYTFRDRDYLTLGMADLNQGTSLASIISKDDDTDSKGLITDGNVVVIKTQIGYQKTNYLNGRIGGTEYDINNSTSFTTASNSGKIQLEAIQYAKTKSEVLLFNDHSPADVTSTDHKHYFTYNDGTTHITCDADGDGTGCGSDDGDTRSWDDRFVNIATNSYYSSIKDEFNDTDNIYVVPVANTEYSDLLDSSAADDGRDYDTLIAVADVVVTDIDYCTDNSTNNCAMDLDGNGSNDLATDGTDEYSVAGIEDITISGFKTDSASNSYTCENILSEHCVIAPGSFYALQNDGSYSTIDNDEYAGSAYVAGIIAKLRGVFSESQLSNENIIAKIVATATAPEYISGCDVDGDGDYSECGSGMVNFYEVLKAVVDDNISVSSLSGSSFDLDSSSISLSGAFGDGFLSGSSGILSKAVFFDNYNFSYAAGLETKVGKSISQKLLLDHVIGEKDYATKSDSFNYDNVSFSVSTNQKDSAISKRFAFSHADQEVKADVSNLSLTGDLGKSASYKIGFDTSYSNKLSNNAGLVDMNGFANFHDSEMDLLSAETHLTDNIIIDGTMLQSDDAISHIASLTYDRIDSLVSLSFGVMSEDDTILGSTTSGAFGDNVSANTNYINLQAIHNIGDIEFYGSASFGRTSVELDSASVFTNMTDIKTEELQFVATKSLRSGQFGVSYTEPLRVTGGTVAISVPTYRDLDDNINFVTEDVSLATIGKERDYELFWSYDVDELTNIELNYVHTKDYGHIKGDDNSLFAVSFSKLF